MNKMIFSALALSALLLGCNKPEPTPVVDTQPVPSLVAPSPTVTGPTTQLEVQGAVKMKAPDSPKADTQAGVKVAAVKKPTTKAHKTRVAKAKKAGAEAGAYRQAFFNKIEYVCIRKVVDAKIDEDIKDGKIHDLGNVVTAFHKASPQQFTSFCVQGGYVDLSDVKEFKGKV